MEDPKTHVRSSSTTIKVDGEEFWSLSGNPYFHVILSKASMKPPYQLTIPAKMKPVLPSCNILASVTYNGKVWKMPYYGAYQPHRRIGSGWKRFLEENNLKSGDACFFEIECSSTEEVKLRAQILRNNAPAEISKKKKNGGSPGTRMIID